MAWIVDQGDVVEAFGFRGVVAWVMYGEAFVNWTHVWRPVFDAEGCSYFGECEFVALEPNVVPGCRVELFELDVIVSAEAESEGTFDAGTETADADIPDDDFDDRWEEHGEDPDDDAGYYGQDPRDPLARAEARSRGLTAL